MRKLIIIFFSFIFIFLTGCNFNKEEKTEINFNLNKNFEIISQEKNDNVYYLTIKSEKNISEYIKEINKHYSNEKLNLEISLFHEYAKDTNFSMENLNDFRSLINYKTNEKYYTEKTYIELPNIDLSDSISEFMNEKIEESENTINIYITMKNIENINKLISELKTYISQVQTLNNTDKNIQIIVNNTYFYNGGNTLIIHKTYNF